MCWMCNTRQKENNVKHNGTKFDLSFVHFKFKSLSHSVWHWWLLSLVAAPKLCEWTLEPCYVPCYLIVNINLSIIKIVFWSVILLVTVTTVNILPFDDGLHVQLLMVQRDMLGDPESAVWSFSLMIMNVSLLFLYIRKLLYFWQPL